MADDYSPVAVEDDEEEKDKKYPPVKSQPSSRDTESDMPPVASGAPIVAPAIPNSIPAGVYPPVTSQAGPNLRDDVMSGKVAPPSSLDSAYKPVQSSRKSDILNRIGAGMAGFKNPAVGVGMRERFEDRPRQVASQNLAHDTNEYNTAFNQGVEQRKLDIVPQKIQSAEDIAEAKNKTAEDIAAGRTKSAETIAGGKNKTAEDIAGKKIASSEKEATANRQSRTEIAKLQNDTRKIIANERVAIDHEKLAAANDPNKLTMPMRTMKQTAQATLPEIDKALEETNAVADLLGPGEGRWNDFIQGKIGISDPKFAHYKDEVAFISTAVTLAHARGRMSNELFEHFQKMFDAGKQSPENMVQAFTVAKEWLTDYANMGEAGSPVGGGGAHPSAPNAPAKPKGQWNAQKGVYE